jgi:chromosomal replication initiation ATPase DnaA
MLRRQRGFGRAALARQLAIYLANVVLARPQQEIAELFGRNRRTVSYALQAIEDRRDSPIVERLIERIERRFDRTHPRTRRVRHGA